MVVAGLVTGSRQRDFMCLPGCVTESSCRRHGATLAVPRGTSPTALSVLSGIEGTPKDLVVPPSEGTGAPQETSSKSPPPVSVGDLGGQSGGYKGPTLVLSKIYKLGSTNLYLTYGRRFFVTLTRGPYGLHAARRDDTACRTATKSVCVCVGSSRLASSLPGCPRGSSAERLRHG